jgi:hypothetical protein
LNALEMAATAIVTSAAVLWMGCHYSPQLRQMLLPLMPTPDRFAAPIALLWVSLKAALVAFPCCLAAAFVFRLFRTTRFVYRAAKLPGKILFLWFPALCLTGLAVEYALHSPSWIVSGILSVVPTAVIFPCCASYAAVMTPETASRSRAESREETPRAETARDTRSARRDSEEEFRHRTTLGLRGDARFVDIRRRYLELAKQYHPDNFQHLGVNLREAADQEMKKLNKAYEYFKQRHEGDEIPHNDGSAEQSS